MELTKKKANYILQRIYCVIREGEVSLVFSKDLGTWSGLLSGKHIIVHPCRKVLSTMVHEFLHLLYPDAMESKVYKWEREMMLLLTDRQLENLACRLPQIMNLIPFFENVLELKKELQRRR